MRYLFLAMLVGLVVGALGVSIYGLYVAFSTSIVLGILALIIEPSPFIIGILMIAFNYNIPQAILDFIK